MEGLPSISEAAEGASQHPTQQRMDSPLHYVDCDDTNRCAECKVEEQGSGGGGGGGQENIEIVIVDEDVAKEEKTLSEKEEQEEKSKKKRERELGQEVKRAGSPLLGYSLPLRHFVTLRRDLKEKRHSLGLAGGGGCLDPGRPPPATSRSMEHLVVSVGVW